MGAGHNRRRPGSEKVIGNCYAVSDAARFRRADYARRSGGALPRSSARSQHAPRASVRLRPCRGGPSCCATTSTTRFWASSDFADACRLGGRVTRLADSAHLIPFMTSRCILFQRGTSVRGTVVYNAQRYSPELPSQLATQLHSIIDAHRERTESARSRVSVTPASMPGRRSAHRCASSRALRLDDAWLRRARLLRGCAKDVDDRRRDLVSRLVAQSSPARSS